MPAISVRPACGMEPPLGTATTTIAMIEATRDVEHLVRSLQPMLTETRRARHAATRSRRNNVKRSWHSELKGCWSSPYGPVARIDAGVLTLLHVRSGCLPLSLSTPTRAWPLRTCCFNIKVGVDGMCWKGWLARRGVINWESGHIWTRTTC
eukprot:NODE_16441_length_995_cov_1.714286.p1 GENE.NODE_16441_length_995_cov_1.714286~~NODE_16441_length_995_cov_1.714286.p1  ORF type:complete len:164 (-),score=21.30 NODE_16441_length_995_cov_1.714286:502-954(-)